MASVKGSLVVGLGAFLALGCPVEDSPAPASVEITPATGLAGTTFPITVRGTNTHFSASSFEARFEGGNVHVFSPGIRVSSETAARLEVTIDAEASPGPRVLRIDAPPDSFVTSLDVTVRGDEPSLSLVPSLGAPGADLLLTLTGTATHFEDGVTTVLFPESAGVIVRSVNAVSPTLATAQIRVSPEAVAGISQVAVVTRDELVAGDFQVVTEAQAAVSVDPPEGYSGSDVDVVVTGSRADFGIEGDVVTLTFEAGASISVSDVLVLSPTRLSARFAIGASAPAGFRGFTVRVDPADADAEPREFAGTFSVRAPGRPSVRLLPPIVRRGETTFLWLEGRGTAFADDLDVRPEAGSGVELTGLWVLGPTAAALRVRTALDAPSAGTTVAIDDGTHEDLTASIQIIEEDPLAVVAQPAFLETGAQGVAVTLTGTAGGFEAGLTRVEAAERSGIAVRSVEVPDGFTTVATVDVQETAPTGPTYLQLSTTSAVVSRAPMTVVPAAGRGSITIEPPVVRAGIGPVELVITGHDADIGPSTVAEVSDPALTLGPLDVDEPSDVARVTVEVPRSAAPGEAVLVLADGQERWATTLTVLSADAPRVTAFPSSLLAGRAERLVVVIGVGTSWLPRVTVAAAPAGRGLSIDGLTVIDSTTALLDVTVSSEAPPGPTGIVLATHGEVAVAPFEIAAPPAVPEIDLEPPSVEPGTSATVMITGTNIDVSGVPVRVELPGSPEIRVVRTLVLSDTTLQVDLEVDAAAEPGTRPCELEAPGLDVRAGLAVRAPGEAAFWAEPARVRRGRTARLEIRVDGMDLAAGPAVATADEPEVIVGEVVVGETADRASVDVSVTSDAPFDAFWLTLSADGTEARHRILLGPVLTTASTGGASVEAGTSGTEVVAFGEDTTFAPEETLVLPGASSSALRFGLPEVVSPEQLRMPVDTSAAADVELAQAIFVTGSELVVATLPVSGIGPVSFGSPGDVQGSVLSDRGAILAFDGGEERLQLLRVQPDVPDPMLSMAVFAPDGFAPLAAPVDGPSPAVVALPSGALVRVQVAAGVEGGDDPLGFSFSARPVVADAAQELEPNDEGPEAELVPDPVLFPTVMACTLEPTFDRDVFEVTASTPVAFELFARRLVAGSGAPDIGIRAPPDAPLVAASLGADLVAVLQPGAPGEEASVSLEGLAGSVGAYLVVARSAVVVNELGWPEDESGYVELRGAPGLPMDGFTIELDDADGEVLLPEVDLSGIVADEAGLVLVSAEGGADLVVAELALPEDGAVVVRWQGVVVDAVAFGAAIGGEREPVDISGATAVVRRLGIDRNDNALDFEVAPPSPGGE